MKSKEYLFVLSISFFSLLSCRKGTVTNNNSPFPLYGSWKLTEEYDGYAMGGNNSWSQVAANESHTIQFTKDGQYIKQENAGSNFRKCTGTYQLGADSSLQVISDCSTTTEYMKITELTGNRLIIDYPVIEGVIRYKYVAE